MRTAFQGWDRCISISRYEMFFASIILLSTLFWYWRHKSTLTDNVLNIAEDDSLESENPWWNSLHAKQIDESPIAQFLRGYEGTERHAQ